MGCVVNYNNDFFNITKVIIVDTKCAEFMSKLYRA